MLARFNRLPIRPCVVIFCAALLPMSAAADPPDAKQVTLTLSGDAESGYTISVDPETAEISRGKKAKIKKRVHAHGLRHTLAAELREENEDIGIISKQLGHSNIGTTARYLDRVAPTKVIKAVSARKWKRKK